MAPFLLKGGGNLFYIKAMNFEPIGFFHGDATYKYDAPRQGRLFAGHPGRIELMPGNNFETALRDLDGFDRIWVIFQFHENKGWRPTTRPPVPPKGRDRVGTFASRSPYRPNPIGLSCVRLLKVEGLTLYVDEADLLDGTPVLDVKPYVPLADAFPDARAGWVEEQVGEPWKIEAAPEFLQKSDWLRENSPFDILSFAKIQLSRGPFDTTCRRMEVDVQKCTGTLAYRTFRIDFCFETDAQEIRLCDIRSGYSKIDLESSEDRYGDKDIHRKFNSLFNYP